MGRNLEMCWTHLHSKCIICPLAKVTGCFQAGYMVARGTHGDPQKQQGPTAWSLSPWGDDTGKRWLLGSNTHLGLGVSSEKPSTCCYLLLGQVLTLQSSQSVPCIGFLLNPKGPCMTPRRNLYNLKMETWPRS